MSPARDMVAPMSDRPPQLRDQSGVRSGLRIGGAIVFAIGAILAIGGFASFFSAFGSSSPPSHFWMAFIGIPMLGIGGTMLKIGYLGPATRYVAGEVMPTVKDSLSYVGIGPRQTTCPTCGETNAADAKFCDHCGTALGITCPSCGHANEPDSEFCSACGKPLRA
jgi:Double zinc ribbon